MASRGQSVTVTYVAWDTSANGGKTGDVANHTLRWVKDGTSSATTNSASEVDSVNAPGIYKITLTGTEATCDVGVLCGKSSTANVSVLPVTVTFEQLPTAAANASGGLLTYGTGAGQINVDGSGNVKADVIEVNGTAQTARDLGAQLDATITSRQATVTFPTNFSALAITVGGGVTVATNSDKTGYTVSTVTDKTGYALTSAEHTAIAGDVWNATASSYNTAGTMGNKLNSAAAAGDPWNTALPGSYAAGTAGYIVGTNLDAAISSRMASFTLPTNFSALAIDVSGRVTVGTNNDKTGYSLSQSFPTNFSSLSIDASGRMDVGKWLGTAVTLSATTAKPQVDVDSWKNASPSALQSGRVDSYIGATAASLTFDLTGSISGTVGGLTSGERDSIADALLDRANGVETGLTPRQYLRLSTAVLANVSTTPSSTQVVYKRRDGTTTALTVDHDSGGARTGSTIGTL